MGFRPPGTETAVVGARFTGPEPNRFPPTPRTASLTHGTHLSLEHGPRLMLAMSLDKTRGGGLAPGPNRSRASPWRTALEAGRRRTPGSPVRAAPRPAAPFGKPRAPDARSAGRCRRAPCPARPARPSGIGRDPRASPRQILSAPDRAAALRLPTLVRTAGDPSSERGSDPAAVLRKERQTTSDNHRPQEPTVRESGVDAVSRALRVLRNQRALPCSAQRPFLRVPGPFRVTCGPQDRPGSTISGSRGVEAGRNATARRSAGIRALAAHETGDRGAEELLATTRWTLLRAVAGAFLGGTDSVLNTEASKGVLRPLEPPACLPVPQAGRTSRIAGTEIATISARLR